jgi:hypothetical protein
MTVMGQCMKSMKGYSSSIFHSTILLLVMLTKLTLFIKYNYAPSTRTDTPRLTFQVSLQYLSSFKSKAFKSSEFYITHRKKLSHYCNGALARVNFINKKLVAMIQPHFNATAQSETYL